MGIYDREYYRDETRGSGFFSGAAPAVKALIFLNLVVFVAGKLFLGTDQMLQVTFDAGAELDLRTSGRRKQFATRAECSKC